MRRRRRHYLHQSACPSPRLCVRVERRLLVALGRKQPPIPPYALAVLHKQCVIARNYAFLAVLHRCIYTAADTFGAKQKVFFALDIGQHRGLEPFVNGFDQHVAACLCHPPCTVGIVARPAHHNGTTAVGERSRVGRRHPVCRDIGVAVNQLAH